MPDLNPMVQYLVWAMEGRGKMSNQRIYKAVKEKCGEHGRTLPPNWEAVIRQTLQAHCSSQPQYGGRHDYFVHHQWGYWSCTATSPSIDEFLSEISN